MSLATDITHETGLEIATELGPWGISGENDYPSGLSLPEIAERWAGECEPEDPECRAALEMGALSGFGNWLAGSALASRHGAR